MRYVGVDFERKTVRIRVSFLGFIHISQKDAESLVGILKQLKKDEMELQDHRPRCSDNAGVKTGRRSDVHQRISEKSELAVFVNISVTITLNLVSVYTAKQDIMMVTYLEPLQLSKCSLVQHCAGKKNFKRHACGGMQGQKL